MTTPHPLADPVLTGTAVVVMGVSGSGKSTLAGLLAERLDVPFLEGDDAHSPAARAKMAVGVPLTDEDRAPWLRRIRDWMGEPAQADGCVLTCSALKRSYRDVLREAPLRVRFLHVTAAADDVADRMRHRRGHYMPPALLPSQLATLEPLGPDEDGVVLANDGTLEELIEEAVAALRSGDPQVWRLSPRGGR